MSKQQQQAAAALLATVSPLAAELGGLFARAGHELALVGGSVRDVFLANRSFQYCPTCQTGGKILADRRLSRLLK